MYLDKKGNVTKGICKYDFIIEKNSKLNMDFMF